MKIMYLRLSLILYMLSSFQSKIFSQDTTAAVNNLKQGVALYNAENYRDAIKYLKKSIDEVPTAYCYFLLGAAYCNDGTYVSAKENENTAIYTSFDPMLTPQRRMDALYIIKFSDSVLNVRTHYASGSGDALTVIPHVSIRKPGNYNPFPPTEMQFNAHRLENTPVNPTSPEVPANFNQDNTPPQQQTATDNTPPEQPAYTIENAVDDYFNGRTGYAESLDGDAITNYNIKSITNNSITISVEYNYNQQHGNEVYLGAWFWNPVKDNNNAGGYAPVRLSSYNESADITISLSDLQEAYTTQSIVVFISEPRKGPFVHRIFYYQHTWTP